MEEIYWSNFEQHKDDPHQWFLNDHELKARYAARKVDGVFEFSIRDELTSDPTAGDPEVIAFIAAVNAYRARRGLANRQATGGKE